MKRSLDLESGRPDFKSHFRHVLWDPWNVTNFYAPVSSSVKWASWNWLPLTLSTSPALDLCFCQNKGKVISVWQNSLLRPREGKGINHGYPYSNCLGQDLTPHFPDKLNILSWCLVRINHRLKYVPNGVSHWIEFRKLGILTMTCSGSHLGFGVRELGLILALLCDFSFPILSCLICKIRMFAYINPNDPSLNPMI